MNTEKLSFRDYVIKYRACQKVLEAKPEEKLERNIIYNEENEYQRQLKEAKRCYEKAKEKQKELIQTKIKTLLTEYVISILTTFATTLKFVLIVLSPILALVLPVVLIIWLVVLAWSNVDIIENNFGTIWSFCTKFIINPVIAGWIIYYFVYCIIKTITYNNTNLLEVKKEIKNKKQDIDYITNHKEEYINDLERENLRLKRENNELEELNIKIEKSNKELIEGKKIAAEKIDMLYNEYPDYNFIFDYENDKAILLDDAIENGLEDAIEIRRYVNEKYNSKIEKEEEQKRQEDFLRKMEEENIRHEIEMQTMLQEQDIREEERYERAKQEAIERQKKQDTIDKKRFEETQKINKKLLDEAKRKNQLLNYANTALDNIYHEIR